MYGDWENWLDYEQGVIGSTYEEILQTVLYQNALDGTGTELHTKPRPITAYWQSMDNEKTYQQNLNDPVQQAKLAKWGWLNRSITYDLNSWGFRSKDCREFETIESPTLITIGCSFTFGTGLPADSIWPTLVSTQLNLDLVNLGVPGHGLDLSVQWLLLKGQTLIRPKAIVVLMPPPNRITWINRAGSDFIASTFLSTHLQNLSFVNSLDINGFANYVKNINIIDLWARSRNIPLYIFQSFGKMETNMGLARDLCHFGVPWHHYGANLILNRIKSID